MESDDRRRQAAAFLAQALDLPDDPAQIAGDLLPVDRTPAVAVFATELDSSVGPAAFLVYAYALAALDDDGRSGRDRFAADLDTLETAAARGAPGPRAVAHALGDDTAFVLATSPATLRVLTGEPPVVAPADAPPLPPGADPNETRRSAAEDLLRLLRAADEPATAWLAAWAASDAGTGGPSQPAPSPRAFTPEETELALFLLDDRSIRHLLQTLNRLIATARDQTAAAMDDDT